MAGATPHHADAARCRAMPPRQSSSPAMMQPGRGAPMPHEPSHLMSPPVPGRPPPLFTESNGPIVKGPPSSTGRSTTPRRVLSSVVQFDPNSNAVQPRARTPRRDGR